VLFLDLSERTYRGYQAEPDDEARVFYVGATRARQTLYVVQPQSRYYYQL